VGEFIVVGGGEGVAQAACNIAFLSSRKRSLLSNGDRIGSDVASATLRERLP